MPACQGHGTCFQVLDRGKAIIYYYYGMIKSEYVINGSVQLDLGYSADSKIGPKTEFTHQWFRKRNMTILL